MDFAMILERAISYVRRHARYFIALAFFLLLLQDTFGRHGIIAMHRSKVKMDEVQAENQKLQQENQELQQRIEKLKTDPHAIEEIARDRMGLARPGELIFRIPDQAKKKQQVGPSPSPPSSQPKD